MSLGQIYGPFENSRQISRRNTVSLETESGEWQALSPLTIQEEISRAPGSHHAKPTCDDAVTEKDCVVPGSITNECSLKWFKCTCKRVRNPCSFDYHFDAFDRGKMSGNR